MVLAVGHMVLTVEDRHMILAVGSCSLFARTRTRTAVGDTHMVLALGRRARLTRIVAVSRP